MVASKTVPTVTVCKRSDIEDRKDFLPTHFFIYIFVI